ncbi:hypothetical protein [Brevundimonas sp. Marseille-Q4549]
MTKRVLVVGHSDADGHVIAEQTRRNLSLVPAFDVSVVVDPARTYGHRSWTHLEDISEVNNADFVVFVDLMFSPATFIDEARGLSRVAAAHPDKVFFVVDHHPLPLGRLSHADNLRLLYRPDVFECVLGPQSGMMVIAAIFERQPHTIKSIKTNLHKVMERGLRRAAALGSPLVGAPLMTLLRGNRWDIIHDLAEEDSSLHRIVRGRRVANQPLSPALSKALEAVKELQTNTMAAATGLPSDEGDDPMPYDVAAERFALASAGSSSYRNAPVPGKDLEALVTLLEVAALSLTRVPLATFSREELLAEARALGGGTIEIDDRDAKIVLEKASFVEWTGGELRLR